MNYSFTRPGKKTILKRVSRIWLGYIALSIIVFLGFVGILKIEGIYMQNRAESAVQTQSMRLEEIKEWQNLMIEEQNKVNFGSVLATQNQMLEQSVVNLFDLIPDQITLNRIEMQSQELRLYGSTPSKQIYTFLLEVPLRSIFHESRAEFYMLGNGWFNFVSVSKIDPNALDQRPEEEQQRIRGGGQ